MKKDFLYTLLFMGALLYSAITYSQHKMSLTLKDGNILEFPVEQIEKMQWLPISIGGDEGNTGDLSVTGNATDIAYFSATVSAYANIMENEATDLRVGIIYCTEGTPNKSNGTQTTVSLSQIGPDAKYSVTLTGLNESTTYYYRSFVFQSGLWRYGAVKSFTTKSGAVMLTIGTSSSVTCFSAKVSANVKVDPSTQYNTLEYGMMYGTEKDSTTKISASNKQADGSYTVTLRALRGNTVYYYRPYAVMDDKTYYGEESMLQTLADNVVETGVADENFEVRSRLTLAGGAYSSLKLGLCWGTSEEPTIDNHTLTINELDDDGYYTLRFTPCIGTTNYRAYVLIDDVPHYGEVKSVYCEKKTNPNNNNHEYVDLDLPSGTLWATCNVGATIPEEYGDYFAWGETESKTEYDWSTYKWCRGTYGTMTKYCIDSSYGTVDNKTTLDPEDDAAHVNWGGDWRMPTLEEQTELLNNCTWTWTSQNSVIGYKVTSKSNGNSIFLPAAGWRSGTSLGEEGSNASYWSLSLYTGFNNNAYLLYCSSSKPAIYIGPLVLGQTVRPVMDGLIRK